MRVLVLAHGDGRRWVTKTGEPFLGQPKHFVRIDGETLLERAVRLFRPAGEVVVVGPDDRYDVPGARRVPLDGINGCGSDMGKFLDTRHLWAADGRTIIVWGDVWYSDAAARTILEHPDDGYRVFRRPGPSTVTGHRWDESFAVSFGPHEHDRVIAAAKTVAAAVTNRQIKASHIRTHYAEMIGAPWLLPDRKAIRELVDTPHQTIIDDWTDDFDTPDEWLGWVSRHTDQRHATGRLKVVVLVPWIPTDCRWRTASLAWTEAHWQSMSVPVFRGVIPNDGLPNRSAARNAAALAATAAVPDWDVAFVADADTFVFPAQFWAAVHLARETDQLVLAFSAYRKITEPRTRALLIQQKTPVTQPAFETRARMNATNWGAGMGFASGTLAVSRHAWETLGGYDERFVGWGGEDRAFWLAALTLLGEAPNIPGYAWHWWHPRAADKKRDADHYQANVALGLRYKAAAGISHQTGALPRLKRVGDPDPDAMRRILAEPGAPHDLRRCAA